MKKDPETVEVAVTIISCLERLLLVYNPNWDAFSLPMTKLHHWPHHVAADVRRYEDWDDAAARSVAEILGQTIVGSVPLLLEHVSDWEESGRDQVVRRYSFRVFHHRVGSIASLAPGVIGQWLTIDEIEDPQRRPISPTVRFLLQQCLAEAAGKGVRFFDL
jgi:hypothetical protein